MPDPDPELADRLEAGYDRCSGIPDALLMAYNGHTHNVSTIAESDLEAAAVRLREQDAEIENLKAANALAVGHLVNVDDLPELTRPPHPHSASLFMAGMLAQRERDAARLRKLDRIEAALGDVPDWIDALEANIGNHCTVMSVSAQADLVTLFRRLADALEDTDAD